MSLHVPLEARLPHKYEAVDLRLRDGTVFENLAVDAVGSILGKVVGGQDGLDERPLPFKQEDVIAYRRRAGLAARFGLARWHRLAQNA